MQGCVVIIAFVCSMERAFLYRSGPGEDIDLTESESDFKNSENDDSDDDYSADDEDSDGFVTCSSDDENEDGFTPANVQEDKYLDFIRNVREFYVSTDTPRNFCYALCQENHKKLWPLVNALEKADVLSLSFLDIESIPREVKFSETLGILFMTDNKLSDVAPIHFETLKNLRKLHLGSNNFTKIPEAIAQLTHLKILDVSKNKIKSDGLEPLSSLLELEYLILACNDVDDLPDSLFNMKSLVSLDLQYNVLRHIPAKIKHLKELKYLRLKSNQLTTIPDDIKHLKKLEILCCSENGIQNIPVGGLMSLPRLRIVCLHRNRLHKDVVSSLNALNKKRSSLIEIRSTENRSSSCFDTWDYEAWHKLAAECSNTPMPPDFDFDVYLLYSGAKADCELVEKIAEKLEREYKKKVCYDSRDFIPGRTLLDETIRAIKSSRKILVVFTENCSKNMWMDYQVQAALTEKTKLGGSRYQFGKSAPATIIPVYWDADAGDQTPDWFKAMRLVGLTKDIQNHENENSFWRKLAKAIND